MRQLESKYALYNTVGDKKWLSVHGPAIRSLLPETWTHTANFDVANFVEAIKPLGIVCGSEDEIRRLFDFLASAKIVLRDGFLVRRGS
jgi:hypothetical protein